MKRREETRRRFPGCRALTGLFLILVGGGCASGRPVADNPFDHSVSQGQVTLRVENQNLHDATIYLRTGGRRQELGTVGSRGVEFFEFPWSLDRPLDLEIELFVGERYRLPPYPFTSGRRLELLISSNLRQSSFRG
ncbi:MAG: hypothetical protein ACWGSQ_14900 [Longimicrobiales bacterium]